MRLEISFKYMQGRGTNSEWKPDMIVLTVLIFLMRYGINKHTMLNYVK